MQLQWTKKFHAFDDAAVVDYLHTLDSGIDVAPGINVAQ